MYANLNKVKISIQSTLEPSSYELYENFQQAENSHRASKGLPTLWKARKNQTFHRACSPETIGSIENFTKGKILN